MGSMREILGAFSQFFRWWIIVAPWEQAVRVRLGKYVILLKEGIHFRIPFVDRIYIHTTRRRLVHVPVQTLTTNDNKHVTVAGSIGFAIEDLLKMYDMLHQPQDTIIQEVMGFVSHYVVTNALIDCSPEKIRQYVNEHINLCQYGLQSFGFIVTDFAVVRTYRLLSGDIQRWTQATLEMHNHESGPAVG